MFDTESEPSEDHKECGPTWIEKDCTDVLEIVSFFLEHNPFNKSIKDLINLETGMLLGV